MKAIFVRIGYMHYYCGSIEGDEKPIYGGSYNRANKGHELYNFKKVYEKKSLFGYFQPKYSVNLEKIDPENKHKNFVENVLVIFVAKRKDYGQVIIGWYKDARVYRESQPADKTLDREDYPFFLKAPIKTSVLLPEKYRTYKIPSGQNGFGQANICYLYNDKKIMKNFRWIKDAINYVMTYKGPNLLVDTMVDTEEKIKNLIERHKAIQSGQGFKVTPELRKKIEEYSMKKAIKFFQNEGYQVTDVSKIEPYDLACKKDNDYLRVEVKGTQSSGDSIVLTPNEIKNAETHKTALYILHSIKVNKANKKYNLSGGKAKIINPWNVDEHGNLKPVSYIYYLK